MNTHQNPHTPTPQKYRSGQPITLLLLLPLMHILFCRNLRLQLYKAQLIFLARFIAPEPVYSLDIQATQLVRVLVEGVDWVILSVEVGVQADEPVVQGREGECGPLSGERDG